MRRRNLVAMLVAVLAISVASFGLTSATTSATDKKVTTEQVGKVTLKQVQDAIRSDVEAQARALSPNQRAELMAQVGSIGGANGVSMHWQWKAAELRTVVSWTFQRNTVKLIQAWFNQNPVKYGTTAAMAMLAAAACAPLTVLGSIVCSAIFAVWQQYSLDQFNIAAMQDQCVTVAVSVSIFQLFNPLNINWYGFPSVRVDRGDWCDHRNWVDPSHNAPTYTGPVMPPQLTDDCKYNPTLPRCL